MRHVQTNWKQYLAIVGFALQLLAGAFAFGRLTQKVEGVSVQIEQVNKNVDSVSKRLDAHIDSMRGR